MKKSRPSRKQTISPKLRKTLEDLKNGKEEIMEFYKSRPELKAFQDECRGMLTIIGMNRILEHLQKPNITTRDLMAIVIFLRDSSFGKPNVRNYQNEQDKGDQSSIISPIIISPEVLKKAEENDKLYSNIEEE
jgi:hypothetical protein